ncbi:RNA-binding protein [Schizosaccharomyces cryophilus OY26]|uniref:RNA-binding protein n=1 Tax=Schizosaccharomyces cryophilus (strain OY26 / ATCC MYA-4695 / CBS 11777 / NBRC 106824 / NRRL Y48691) TaxID=653667 RepID=S9VSY6_SCHCR|nr:RNA-binding protein [Schizosaccharomyces cryophilus OY26]EPY50988.1 RNA-binding protein [Schizosaccharomyces cryophilus OY26]
MDFGKKDEHKKEKIGTMKQTVSNTRDIFINTERNTFQEHNYDKNDDNERNRDETDSKSNFTPRFAGVPNQEIILQGLAPTTNEQHVSEVMSETGGDIDSIVLIRDKVTRESKCFSFVKFVSLTASKQWMEKYFPSIHIDDRDVSVRYSREAREEIDGWKCENCDSLNYSFRDACFKCKTLRSNVDNTERNGSNDVGDIPTFYLLLRNLDRCLNDLTLLKGIAKLECNVQRLFMIRQKKDDSFCGYAIIELPNVDEAAKTLTMARTFSGKAFTIASRKVLVDYIHEGVFVPAQGQIDTWKFPTKDGYRAYWDENLYCSTFVPDNVDQEQFKPIAKTQKQKKEKRLRTNLVEPPTNKKIALTLARWQGAQRELTEDLPELTEEEEKFLLQYIWKSSLICVLCERKFNSWGHVLKHLTQSFLHQKNLKNSSLVTAAEGFMNRIREIERPDYRDRATERRAIHITDNTDFSKEPTPLPDPYSRNRSLGNTSSETHSHESFEPTAYLPGVGLGTKNAKVKINMTPVDRVKTRARSLYFDKPTD